MVNLGLIGAGNWGKKYILAFENISNANISWVFSKNRDLEEGEIPKCAKFTKDYKEILEDKHVEGIIIATPPETHFEIARDSLDKNKNVLLEKPFTTCSEDAKKLIELSIEKDKILMAGHQYLYHSYVDYIKKVIESGELGKIERIISRRMKSGSESKYNALWNLAPHDIYLANFLIGSQPKEIYAEKIIKKGLEQIKLSLSYEKDIDVIIEVANEFNEKIRKMMIYGTKSNLIFDDLEYNKVTIINNKTGEMEKPFLGKTSPLENQCRNFINSINKTENLKISNFEGYENVKILEYAQNCLNK